MSRFEPFRFVAADMLHMLIYHMYRSEDAYMRKYHRYGPYHMVQDELNVCILL